MSACFACIQRGQRLNRRVMETANSKCSNTGLAQLGKARSNKTTVLLIWIGSIKQVTGLHKEIDTLADGKISRLLKSVAKLLLVLFALTRMLNQCAIPSMIISGYHKRTIPP